MSLIKDDEKFTEAVAKQIGTDKVFLGTSQLVSESSDFANDSYSSKVVIILHLLED